MKKLQLKDVFLSVALATAAMAPAAAADAPAPAATSQTTNKDMMKVLSFVKSKQPIPAAVTKILEDYKSGRIKPDLQNYDAEAVAKLPQPPLALLPDSYKAQIAAAYKNAAANENLAGLKLNGKAVNTLYTALKLLRQQYVLPLGPDRLEDKAIEGLAMKHLQDAYEGKPAAALSDMDLIEAALTVAAAQDPHSDYWPPKQNDDMSAKMAGHFAGLGLNVSMQGGEVKNGVPAGGKITVSPREDSPAAAAGMKEGDLVIAIQQGRKGEGEKKSVVKTASEPGLTLEEAVVLMKGDVDTYVTLTVERGGKTFETEIKRAVIEINPVTTRIIDMPSDAPGQPGKKVGYITLKEFTGISAEKVEQGIEKLQNDPNGAPDSWVLDLSNNPGGRVDQVLYIADLFLTKGLILAEKGRGPDISAQYAEQFYAGDILKGQKLSVIINHNSASASEILSGALKDNGRAEVIGSTSFGKGSVQRIAPLPNGGGLHETIQLYYTPSGSIQLRGVVPDTEVSMPWMKKDANQYGERNMKGAIPYPGKLEGLTDAVSAPASKTCTAPKRAFTEQEAAGINKNMFEQDPDSGKVVKFSADEKSWFGYKRDDKDGKTLLLKEALACAIEGTYGIEKLTRTTPLPTSSPAPIRQLTPR